MDGENNVAGITEHPSAEWVEQQARNMTGFDGELSRGGYLIHDRDSKYTARFDHIMKEAGVKPIRLPLRSPNLNRYVAYYTPFSQSALNC